MSVSSFSVTISSTFFSSDFTVIVVSAFTPSLDIQKSLVVPEDTAVIIPSSIVATSGFSTLHSTVLSVAFSGKTLAEILAVSPSSS